MSKNCILNSACETCEHSGDKGVSGACTNCFATQCIATKSNCLDCNYYKDVTNISLAKAMATIHRKNELGLRV